MIPQHSPDKDELWQAATKSNDAKELQEILKRADASAIADLDVERSIDGSMRSALDLIILRGQEKQALALISAGINVNRRSSRESNLTPLMNCAMFGYAGIAQALLDAGADPNIQDGFGMTALMYATRNGRADVIKVLLRAGADTTLKSNWGETALQEARDDAIRDLVKNFAKSVAIEAAPPADKPGEADKLPPQLASTTTSTTTPQSTAVPPPAPPTPAAPAAATSPAKEQRPTSSKLASAQEFFAALLAPTARAPTSPTAAASQSQPKAAESAQLPLIDVCDALLAQAALAPARLAATQRLNALQVELAAADAAGTDFELIAQLGKAVKAARLECAQLPLSEADFLSLAERHAALVERVTAQCRELREQEDFDALGTLGAKLKALRAVDVSALPNPADSDPVYVEPSV